VNRWTCPTGAEMLAVDRDAIERLRIPGHTLMETAGRAVARAIAELYTDSRRPLVVCGGGNNGGDGYVIARVLAEQGRGVAPRVLELGSSASQSPEAKANRDQLASAGVGCLRAEHAADVTAALDGCDLVVDAVFGVGLGRPIEGRIAECLRALGSSGLPCVAVDLPSGLSSETGQPLGMLLEADLIVTFAMPKLGLALYPTDARILVADIGLPAECVARAAIRQHVLTQAGARALLPVRKRDGHKGSFGHVLVVGGSLGKTGAAILSALGALRGGAGLVSLAAPRALTPIYAASLAEAMCVVLDGAPADAFGHAQLDELVHALDSRDVLVLGPGLGQAPDTTALVRALLARARVPAVVDADALNVFAGDAAALASASPRVLTPHPGEAARLLGSTIAAIQADRPAAARALAAQSGAIAVLKGARTVIAAPDGELCVNPTGGPGLAAGGSGDVLAGLIGALLAQGLSAWDAARLGAYLHGLAGDRGPSVGGLASELAARIPAAWHALASASDESDSGTTLAPFP
jgi:hydroxyethylthiazole kinase-like uncharacterized protein yjeF